MISDLEIQSNIKENCAETLHVNTLMMVSPGADTLPETNVAPENRPKPNRKVVFQPSICRGELLVLGSVFVKF